MKKYPSAELVRQLLDYDPCTGIFRWRTRVSQRALIGTVAGNNHPSGYTFISISHKLYAGHRLAWLYVYGECPKGELDHINGNKRDNRIENLREATRSQNVANMKRRSPNESGFKGVTRIRNRWQARIRKGQSVFHIGCYATPEEAHHAYMAKAIELFGEFANPG